jgi:hypothetical protein
MSRVYHAHTLEAVDAAGLRHFVQFGEKVIVEGTPYVRVGTSLVQQDDGWRETRGDAIRDVAKKAEALADLLRVQASLLRTTADKEDASREVPA